MKLYFPGLSFLLVCISTCLFAQNTATLKGVVRDENGKPMPSVSISIVGVPEGASSNEKGEYSYTIPADKQAAVVFSFIGYKIETRYVLLKPGAEKTVNVSLQPNVINLPTTEVEDRRTRESFMARIDPRLSTSIPNPSGGLENLLKHLGANSSNDLSSQYSVRGGNFDENLVYINDVEIYRPFLIRAGQQEGLSMVNPDMVSSVLFSTGGFEAKYGDKLSSVLDIKYLKPYKFGGSVSASMLGGSASLEGTSKNRRLSFLSGIRYKSNAYLLNSLDTKGEYKPNFTDFQTYLTYTVSDKLELQFLGIYSRNLYRVVPQNRETNFGTINEAIRLQVYFEGQEVDKFENTLGALSATYQVNKKLRLRFIASAFTTEETASADILGQYYLDELERDLGSKNFGNVAFSLGVGSFLNHTRNEMSGFVYNGEHRGYYDGNVNHWSWGLKAQHESVEDKVKEWRSLDSADYNVPHHPYQYYPYSYRGDLVVKDLLSTSSSISSNRFSGFIQNSIFLTSDKSLSLTAGIRANHLDLNKQTVFSPRVTLSYRPKGSRDLLFRAAVGYYHQPPFFRELRNYDGGINPELRAQRSIHFVGGADYNFRAWNRQFKFVGEAYYKKLDDIVSYKIDEVRVRYSGSNNSSGYATGADFRINGEFVKGLESWASLSFLQTREDLRNDYYYVYYNKAGERIIPGYTFDTKATDSVRHEPGYIPRPTDQRMTFTILFQDYLPKFPSYRMHLSLVFGTGLPIGPPGRDRYKDTLRLPPYRRMDIGFSKEIISENKPAPANMPFLKNFKAMWISLDIFNLLQVYNTVSYLWIKDVNNRQYAVPNYLTTRLVNLKLYVRF